jgi:hypothetical protein
MTPIGQGRFTRVQLRRFVVDRIRLRKYGNLLIDTYGRIYPKGLPWFIVSDNETWRTLLVQAATAGHARQAALDKPEKWGGWNADEVLPRRTT